VRHQHERSSPGVPVDGNRRHQAIIRYNSGGPQSHRRSRVGGRHRSRKRSEWETDRIRIEPEIEVLVKLPAESGLGALAELEPTAEATALIGEEDTLLVVAQFQQMAVVDDNHSDHAVARCGETVSRRGYQAAARSNSGRPACRFGWISRVHGLEANAHYFSYGVTNNATIASR
jgi:hypothetical protein